MSQGLRDYSREVKEARQELVTIRQERDQLIADLAEARLQRDLAQRFQAEIWKATTPGEPEQCDKHRSVDVTEAAGNTLRQLLPPARTYEGSVEGRLETISIHGKTRFILYHAITKKAVTCHISKDELATVKDALGHKVLAEGTLTINVKSEPIRMDVASLRVIGNKTLPLAAELTGSDPDFTGSLTTDEYIRSIRSG